MNTNMSRDGAVTVNPINIDNMSGIVGGKSSKIRNGHTSPIRHQELYVLAQYAKAIGDEAWYNLFFNAAKGSFQKPLKYDNMCFNYKKKNQILRYYVDFSSGYPINVIYETCKDFLSKASGFAGDADENIAQMYYGTVESENMKWSGSISIKQQILLITLFSNRKAKQYNFTNERRDVLTKTLISAITSRSIPNTDIITDSFNIVDIVGLTLYEGNFHLNYHLKPVKISNSCSQTPSNQINVLPCSRELSALVKRRNCSEFLNWCVDM